MNKANFEGLMRSLKEARAYAQGKSMPSLKANQRRHVDLSRLSRVSSASPPAPKKHDKSQG